MRPDWSPQIAESRARGAGMRSLGERHWKVIACLREEVARRGRTPGLDRIERLTGIGDAEIHSLFPGESEALIAYLAGVEPHKNSGRHVPSDSQKER